MTENEWMTSTDSVKMIEFFHGTKFDVRLRRFAVACCQRVSYLITDNVIRATAIAGEAFANDHRNEKGTIKVMAAASITARRHLSLYETSAHRHELRAANAAIASCAETDWKAAVNAMREAARAANRADPDCGDCTEILHQADLLRCIFGNPYRAISFNTTVPTCENDTSLMLAQAIYDKRAFDRLPLLAEALEKAGYLDPDVLNHCRLHGKHFQGCWVLDLILGKGNYERSFIPGSQRSAS